MRLSLRPFEFRISSIASLGLDDPGKLMDIAGSVAGFESARDIRFFGSGDRLKPITLDAVGSEFAKGKAESYSFADVRDLGREEPGVLWSVGIRRALATVRATTRVVGANDLPKLAAELVELNLTLLECFPEARVDLPYSFLDAVDVEFARSSPPRFFGAHSENALVDVVHLPTATAQGTPIVDALRKAALPDDVARATEGDLLVVRWMAPGAALGEALARRYSWYVDHGDFQVDSSYTEQGDRALELVDPRPVEGLTNYSAIERTAIKAVVFDLPDEIRDVLEQLKRMLDAHRTPSGEPLENVTVVVPMRDDAIRLRPLAQEYGLEVAYVGGDDRIWTLGAAS